MQALEQGKCKICRKTTNLGNLVQMSIYAQKIGISDEDFDPETLCPFHSRKYEAMLSLSSKINNILN